MGCKSPVFEPCYCCDYKNINTSQRQGRNREGPSEVSRDKTIAVVNEDMVTLAGEFEVGFFYYGGYHSDLSPAARG